jgi:hypothetical protein
MRKIIGLIVVTSTILALSACSSGPSESKAEDAFLAFIKDNSSDDAKLTSFDLGKCDEANGGYNCAVAAHVVALGGSFDEDYNGVFTFSDVGGSTKVVGVVSRAP